MKEWDAGRLGKRGRCGGFTVRQVYDEELYDQALEVLDLSLLFAADDPDASDDLRADGTWLLARGGHREGAALSH